MIINRIKNSEWKLLFESCSSSNFFNSPQWLEIQAKVFKLNNMYFLAKFNGHSLAIAFQEKNNLLYSNFIAYGGYLTEDNEKLEIKELYEIINVLSKNGYKLSRLKTFPLVYYEGDNHIFKKNKTAWLKILPSDLEQQKYIDKKTRNLVRKAILEGVIIKPIKKNDINKFYSFYIETMERVESSYLTPFELFEYFSQVNNIDFLGAYLDEELIAGSVFFRCNKGMFYWINSSSQKGRSTNANYLLIKSAIDNARESGIEFMDMGSSHSDRILYPKLKWGAKQREYFTL